MNKFFLLLVSFFLISADTIEKYQGDISPKEKRIRQYKEEIADLSYSFPEQLKLYFKKNIQRLCSFL